jgi:hypothetical protein
MFVTLAYDINANKEINKLKKQKCHCRNSPEFDPSILPMVGSNSGEAVLNKVHINVFVLCYVHTYCNVLT